MGRWTQLFPFYRQGKAGQLTHGLVKAPVEFGSGPGSGEGMDIYPWDVFNLIWFK